MAGIVCDDRQEANLKSLRWIGLGLIALVLLLGGTWLGYTQSGSYGSWGMMRGPGMMWGSGMPMMGGFGGLGMVLFWGLVIAGVIWLIRVTVQNSQQPSDKGPASEPPLDVIKRRYANGEINKEQFEEIKRTLSL